jgi:hypothetical protein
LAAQTASTKTVTPAANAALWGAFILSVFGGRQRTKADEGGKRR